LNAVNLKVAHTPQVSRNPHCQKIDASLE
jgi:hypothetical protein